MCLLNRCYSNVGLVGGGQRISIGRGCEHTGIVIHEMFHALGRWHEQSRPDRDQFVSINYNNMKDGKFFNSSSNCPCVHNNACLHGADYILYLYAGVSGNFLKLTTNQVTTQGVPYDFGSIMHYSSHAFSRNGRPTIEPKDRSVSSSTLGQRSGFSTKDLEHANTLYCSDGKR